MQYWLSILVFLIVGVITLFYFDVVDSRRQSKVSARFQQLTEMKSSNQKHHLDTLRGLLLKKGLLYSSEFKRLFIQSGWDSKVAISVFWIVGRLLAFILAIVVFIVSVGNDEDFFTGLFRAIFVFAVIFVGANMLLRWRAKVVAKAIVKELIPFLHIIRMLFNAGLSLEHVLIIMAEQSRHLIPHLSKHLRRMRLNLNAGQDQADALMHTARALSITEVTDAFSVIYQVSKYGGNVQTSLGNYISLLHNRQSTMLREYVSKLSAKMSIVMIIFMFPALVIFIAGPGFVGISNVLNGG